MNSLYNRTTTTQIHLAISHDVSVLGYPSDKSRMVDYCLPPRNTEIRFLARLSLIITSERDDERISAQSGVSVISRHPL